MKELPVLFVLFSLLLITDAARAQAPYRENLGSIRTASGERQSLDSLFLRARSWQARGAGHELETVSRKALHLAQELRDDSLLSLAHYYLAGGLLMTGHPDEALANFRQALIFTSDTRDIRLFAAILSGVGRVYESRDNYHEALTYFLRSFRLREKSGDDPGVAESLNNVGIIHYNTGNGERALQYYLRALQIRKAHNDSAGISETLHNIALLYEGQGRIEEAVLLYREALEINEKQGFMWRAALNYNNLGSCAQALGHTSAAMNYHIKAMNVQEAIGDVKNLALSRFNVASDYFGLGRTDSSKLYALKALAGSEQAGNLYIRRNILLLMGKIEERQGNYPAALAYTRQGQILNDSIYNAESQRLIADMNTKHEVRNKENEILQLKQQRRLDELNARNRIYRLRGWLSLTLTVIVVAGSIFLIARMRRAKKDMQLRETENLEKIRQQAAWSHALIEVQEHERKRIARELHDGICQSITISRLNLVNIPRKEKLDADTLEAISHTADALDQTYRELRALSHQMLPKALEVAGLCDAMEDLMSKTFAHSPVRSSFEKGRVTGLNRQQEASIYRIFQELISNVIRHAQATEVSAQIYTVEKMLVLLVEDNGVGIQKQEPELYAGVGMSNIRYRVQLLNGTFSFESPASGGTLTMIRIPLDPAASDR